MANKYLDYAGVQRLVTKIKALINSGGGSALEIEDVTSSFTSSNSRLVVRKAVKYGKVINLKIGILRSASWSSSTSSDLTATLTSDYLPIMLSTTSYAWSTGSIEGRLESSDTTASNLSFRNCSGTSISASSGNYIDMTFTYIYDDGTLS